MTAIRNVQPGAVIRITAIVIENSDGSGNVLCQVPGVGKDGGWSITKNAEVEILVPAEQYQEARRYLRKRRNGGRVAR